MPMNPTQGQTTYQDGLLTPLAKSVIDQSFSMRYGCMLIPAFGDPNGRIIYWGNRAANTGDLFSLKAGWVSDSLANSGCLYFLAEGNWQ